MHVIELLLLLLSPLAIVVLEFVSSWCLGLRNMPHEFLLLQRQFDGVHTGLEGVLLLLVATDLVLRILLVDLGVCVERLFDVGNALFKILDETFDVVYLVLRRFLAQ